MKNGFESIFINVEFRHVLKLYSYLKKKKKFRSGILHLHKTKDKLVLERGQGKE